MKGIITPGVNSTSKCDLFYVRFHMIIIFYTFFVHLPAKSNKVWNDFLEIKQVKCHLKIVY